MGENHAKYKVDPRDFTEEQSEPRVRDTAPFRALLERALGSRPGSIAALAERLDMTPSHTARLRKGLVGPSVEVIIRVADVAGEDPVVALHACGHPWLADRIDALRRPGQ